MKSIVRFALAAGALACVQATGAAPAEAGWRGYVVNYPAACCNCYPRFGYYKTTQYWPVSRYVASRYVRLVSYRSVNVRRDR